MNWVSLPVLNGAWEKIGCRVRQELVHDLGVGSAATLGGAHVIVMILKRYM